MRSDGKSARRVTMNDAATPFEQLVRRYFGDMLTRHGFARASSARTAAPAVLGFESGPCRIRFSRLRDGDIAYEIGGADASWDTAVGGAGWLPLGQMLDFMQARKDVDHLVAYPPPPFDAETRSLAAQLDAALPRLLAWFAPAGLDGRLAAYRDYDAWQRREVERRMRRRS